MARAMRKIQLQLPQEAATLLLAQGKEGVLAVHGDDGYPYAVPVNYVYEDNTIYIHGAKLGYKMDAVQANPKVCFTVVREQALIESQTTTKFASVIALGQAVVLTEDAEKTQALERIVRHLAPSNIPGGMNAIPRLLPAVGVIKITVESLTGKCNP